MYVHPRFVPVRWDEFMTHYTMVGDKTRAYNTEYKKAVQGNVSARKFKT